MQGFNVACFCLLMAPSGFGGRGVLPGVATGTDLSPKSSKISFFTHELTLNFFHRH